MELGVEIPIGKSLLTSLGVLSQKNEITTNTRITKILHKKIISLFLVKNNTPLYT